jgi:histidine triad (HIT) family protein
MNDVETKKEQLISQLTGLPDSQIKTLKEKIMSMSPEDFEKFTQRKCLFCEIISGNVDAFKVYEDEEVLAVLDINPISRGHAIIMPKKHFQFLFQIPDELVKKLFAVSKNLMPILVNVTKSQGVNLLVNQGITAGQHIEHFSINLIPRHVDDKIAFDAQRQVTSKSELEDISSQIIERVQAEEERREKIAKEKKATETAGKTEDEKRKEDIEKIYRQIKPRIP